MEYYKVSSWGLKIEKVEVTRVSDSSVWIMYNGRERRESNMYYFETLDQAKQSIIDRRKKSLEHAINAVKHAEKELDEAMNHNPVL